MGCSVKGACGVGVGEHLEDLGVGEMAIDTQRLQQAAVPEACSRLCGSVDVDAPQDLVLGDNTWAHRSCSPDEAPEKVAARGIWAGTAWWKRQWSH